MRNFLIAMLIISATMVCFAEDLLNTTNASSGSQTIDTPFGNDSKVCVFLREWVLKGVFMVILLIFLLGIATISGAAFPEWREKGGMMILGAVGAIILFLIGMPALRFLTGMTFCGIGA